MFKYLVFVVSSSFLLSSSAFAGCGGADGACLNWVPAPQYAAPANNPRVDYSHTSQSTSSRQISGLSPGESLCPVDCAVTVEAPQNAQVLDCYKICSAATTPPAYAPPQAYKIIRVVSPIIYVPDYVHGPTAISRAPDCQSPCKPSRYGY